MFRVENEHSIPLVKPLSSAKIHYHILRAGSSCDNFHFLIGQHVVEWNVVLDSKLGFVVNLIGKSGFPSKVDAGLRSPANLSQIVFLIDPPFAKFMAPLM